MFDDVGALKAASKIVPRFIGNRLFTVLTNTDPIEQGVHNGAGGCW